LICMLTQCPTTWRDFFFFCGIKNFSIQF
jgi:hypothetical protein